MILYANLNLNNLMQNLDTSMHIKKAKLADPDPVNANMDNIGINMHQQSTF